MAAVWPVEKREKSFLSRGWESMRLAGLRMRDHVEKRKEAETTRQEPTTI